MSTFKKVLILLTVCVLAPVSLRASEESPVDSLVYKLESAKTPGDSLAILYDIFDIAPATQRLPYLHSIIDICRQQGDVEGQLDMLRNLGNIAIVMSDPSLVEEAMDIINTLPDSEEKRQTKVLLRAAFATADIFETEDERKNYTRQLLKSVLDLPANSDPYEKAARLFALVGILAKQTRGELLSQYLDILDQTLNNIPQLENNFLRSYFNFFASVAYFQNDEAIKSLRSDRNQMLYLKRLEKLSVKQGRLHRNFDASRYNCLRRMLQVEDALSDKEFADVKEQIFQILANNPTLEGNFYKYPLGPIGIALHEKRYEDALPLIQKILDKPNSLHDRVLYTRKLIEVAEKMGRDDIKHEAEIQNYSVLEEYLNHKNKERVNELELLYDVNALRREQITERLNNERRHNSWLMIIIGVLLMTSILLGILYYHSHRRISGAIGDKTKLEDRNETLQQKIDLLKEKLAEARRRESEKTQLMTYVSHELSTPLAAIINYSQMITEAIPDKEVKGYVGEFVKIIETNTQMIQTVTADMQEFALNESKPVTAEMVPVDPNAIATIAAETIEPKLDPKIKLKVTPSSGAQKITSDPRRIQLLLISCIDNMVRSIASGTVTVRVIVSPTICQFVVSAPGATPGNEQAHVPTYNATLNSVNGRITFNPEVPSMTLTLTL